MLYIISNIWLWMVLALAIGIIVGWRSSPARGNR